MWSSRKSTGTALTLCLLLMTAKPTPLRAQKTGGAKNTVSQQIALIRQRYTAIDSPAKKYVLRKRTTQNNDPIGDGRDQDYTGYYEKNDLRKVVVKSYGDHGTDIWKYYFWQGKLFFIHHVGIAYYGDKRLTKVTWAERLYFAGDKVIRWLGDKNTLKAIDTPAAREAADDIRAAGHSAVKILSAPAAK